MNQSNYNPNESNLCRDEIAKRAYFLWEKEGKVQGRDEQYWLQAETQLIASRKQEIELQKSSSKLTTVDSKVTQKPAKSKAQPQYA
jgi:hypothetical protein